MNKGKKDNKGFSLVELIVVILIMAILAVALTPQVLKWVNNSRKANDMALMQSLISNAQTALTNKAAYEEISGMADSKTFVVEVDGTGTTATKAGTTVSTTNKSDFADKLASYSGYPDFLTAEKGMNVLTTSLSTGTITITITKEGLVTGKYNDGTNDITGLDTE